MIRQVLVSFVGHVDHGKSSILDRIRGTTIVEREAGAITQAIGASVIPIDTVRRVAGKLLDALKINVTIPGFLAIDTPGHAAFTNLRKRGGSLADIAVVVIDMNEGFKPQTIEAIEILRAHKTPFVIAANKIDLVAGWQSKEGSLLGNLNVQSPQTVTAFETKMYEIVGELFERFQMESERFDRVSDYTKQIAIVPTSASTGEGIAELLMVLTGLAQKFFEKNLEVNPDGPAKGVVLEVKEEVGIGTSLDAIIFDGSLKVGDEIVIAGVDEPIVTKVKALFVPAALKEMRDKRTKFNSIKEVTAAAGVKVSAKEIDDVVAGMPLSGTKGCDIEEIKTLIQREVDELLLETDGAGILIKADSIGSLEALVTLLREANVSIRSAGIGPITRKDVLTAEGNIEEDPLTGVILGFNVDLQQGVEPGKVKVFSHEVVYKLIEDLIAWQEGKQKALEMQGLHGLVRPGKFQIMNGYVFRQSNPAVVGVDVLDGQITTGANVMTEAGDDISTVKNIQHEQESLKVAERGKQVAVSLTSVVVGRQIKEGDTLYISVPEKDFRAFKELKHLLNDTDKRLLKELALIKREKNPVWGV